MSVLAHIAAIRRELDALEADHLLAPPEVAPETPKPAPAAPVAVQAASLGLTEPAKFFASVRGALWPKLSESQVRGCEIILSAGAGVLPLSWMAYVLATAYHETAYTMEPIKERGSHAYLDKYDTGKLAAALGNTPEDDDDGQLYAGRGYPQTTGLRNYTKANEELHKRGVLKPGEDLVKTPDLMMRPDVAVATMIYGMLEGWFTGKRLNSYLQSPATEAQFTNARRIINGTDKAAAIAGYAVKFQAALKAGGWK